MKPKRSYPVYAPPFPVNLFDIQVLTDPCSAQVQKTPFSPLRRTHVSAVRCDPGKRHFLPDSLRLVLQLRFESCFVERRVDALRNSTHSGSRHFLQYNQSGYKIPLADRVSSSNFIDPFSRHPVTKKGAAP